MGRSSDSSVTRFQIFQTCNSARGNIREDWVSPTHGRSWTYRGTPDIASTTGRGFWSFWIFWVGSQRSTLWRLCHLCWCSAVSLNFTVSVVRICCCCNIFMIEKQLRFSVIHSRRHLDGSEKGKQEPSCSEIMRNIAKLYSLALKTHPKSACHSLSMPKALVTFCWYWVPSQSYDTNSLSSTLKLSWFGKTPTHLSRPRMTTHRLKLLSILHIGPQYVQQTGCTGFFSFLFLWGRFKFKF